MNTPAITAPAVEPPQRVAPAKVQQTGFAIGFIWAALSIALTMGFASFIQVHGHVQLLGWTGLFIISISLHFIPRLIGAPIGPLRLVLVTFLEIRISAAIFVNIGIIA